MTQHSLVVIRILQQTEYYVHILRRGNCTQPEKKALTPVLKNINSTGIVSEV